MIIKQCKICNKIFNIPLWRKKTAKYCSNKCRGLSMKGYTPWNKGKTIPYNPHYKHRGCIPYNKQVKQKKLCLWCKKHMLLTKWEMRVKKYCSNRCKDKAHAEAQRGEKSHFWKDGSSSIYPINWTQTLKKSIRKRDKYTCQKCGKVQSNRAFDVHHKDGNKKNCDSYNLTTLCHSCHIKVEVSVKIKLAKAEEE